MKNRILPAAAALWLLLASSAAAATGAPPGPAQVQALVDELASIERRGIDLENVDWNEVLRDSLEAKRVNELRRRLALEGAAAHAPLTTAVMACQRASTLEMLLGVMAELGVQKAIGPLAARLADPGTDLTLRRRIPRYLGRLGNAGQIPALEGAAGEADLILAKTATASLAALKERAGVPVLRKLLKEGSPAARSAAAQALGEVEAFEAVPELVEALLDTDAFVRTFAQGALSSLTFRHVPYQPMTPEQQHDDWLAWWKPRAVKSRRELRDEAFETALRALGGTDAGAGLEQARWLAEITFRQPPNPVFFQPGVAGSGMEMERARWKAFLAGAGDRDRIDWFREVIDEAVERLQVTSPSLSWEGLNVLHELLPRPEGAPYRFRDLWKKTPESERLRLAEAYREWWQANREKFSPLGQTYW